MSRGRRRRAALVALAAVVVGGCADASSPADESVAVAPIAISDAWARATVPAATTGAVYLDLTAAAGDELVGAAVSDRVASDIALHQNVTGGTDDGDDHNDSAMVTMTALDRLALPAGEPVALEPGTAHLMLVDLAQPLIDGSSFDVTLQFQTADDVTVVVDVREDA